jgi:hypothetical protein
MDEACFPERRDGVAESYPTTKVVETDARDSHSMGMMSDTTDERLEAAKDFLATCLRIYHGSKTSEASETAMGQLFYFNADGALTTIGLLFGLDVEEQVRAWLAGVGAPFPTELPVALQKLVNPDMETVEFFATYSAPPIE